MTRKLKEFVNQARPETQDRFPSNVSDNHVCILLALHNGAATLGEQLKSIADQSHKDWSLIISDDGSDDDWYPLVSRFSEQNRNNQSWLTRGPQKGFARNFLSLVCHAGPMVPYAAFCDQDDVWLKSKLARALAHLRTVPEGTPAVYASRTMICDHNLKPLRPSLLFKRPPGFGNALVQSIGGGNTMVLNRAALDLVQDSAANAGDVVAHDWWVYQLITGAGGQVCYDPTPTVLYRQHGGNLIGANDGFAASLARVWRLIKGDFRGWNQRNLVALHRSRHWLTKDAQRTLDAFVRAREDRLWGRLTSLHRSGVSRQTLRGTFALWLAAVINRL